MKIEFVVAAGIATTNNRHYGGTEKTNIHVSNLNLNRITWIDFCFYFPFSIVHQLLGQESNLFPYNIFSLVCWVNNVDWQFPRLIDIFNKYYAFEMIDRQCSCYKKNMVFSCR